MRVGLIADIHGNVRALEAVVRDLTRTSPNVVVNLGDHVSGPLWASETADLLIDQTSWSQIRGNHDRQILETPRDDMVKSDCAAIAQLSSRHLSWLASLAS